MKKIFYNFLIIIAAGFAALSFRASAPVALAADFTVTPAVIDAHGLPRDIFDYQLTITNVSGRQQNIFASVNELTADGKQVFGDPSISDRPASLANWIQISRGAMMFQPGETKTIPVEIMINPSAVSGEYHAVIAFVEGGTRADAEQHLNGAPQTLVNMAVASNAKEVLQLDNFHTEKAFYSTFPVAIDYSVENTGNVSSTPAGVVLFYDRIGHELGSVDANPGRITIGPGETKQFSVTWKEGPSFGQYKAVLQLSYGANDATLANTALFWILPWQKLLIIFGTLLAAFIFLAIWLHKKYERGHYRRVNAVQSFSKNRNVIDLRQPHHRND